MQNISMGLGGRHPALLPAVLLSIAVCSGCNQGPAMSQVSGKVFYKDGTVPAGGVNVIRLEPAGDSPEGVRKGASSAIEPDGSFTMFTRTPGDGVIHGEYFVTFGVLKSVMDPTPLIQPKYQFQAQTPYKITVDGNVTDLKFEIEPLPGVKGRPAVAGNANSAAAG